MGSPGKKARLMLWAVTLFMLAVPLYFLLVIAPGRGQLIEGIVRLCLTIALLFFLIKGRPWARLTLAAFALTGSVYLNIRLAFFHEDLLKREIAELAVKDIGYTASGLLLAFSQTLKEFLSDKDKS